LKKLSYHILRVLNILLAGALLFSYLAPYINPATFALPALFGLAYPYLLILNLLFICLWLIQLKKAVFLSLVVVLIGWGHLNHLLPLNGKSGELPEDARPLWSVKLMSYNVRGFNRYNWNTNPNVRNDLFTFLQKEKPDILCIQETKIGEDQIFYCNQRGIDTEKAIGHLNSGLELYFAEVAWRTRAATEMGPALAAYDNAIKETIGLRLQRRLSPDQVKAVAS